MQFLQFFEALATMPGDSTEWRALSTGLVVLRAARASAHHPLSAAELASHRTAVDALPPSTHRNLLTAVVSALAADQAASLPVRLVAYGRALQSDGQWMAAADVYELSSELALAREDYEIMLQATLLRAFSFRRSARFADAERTYESIAGMARTLRLPRWALEARLGFAKLALERGNMPGAGQQLDSIIAAAEMLPDGAILLAKALHDRSYVAGTVGDFFLMLKCCHRALSLTEDPRERDRVLVNVAEAFAGLGRSGRARAIHLVLMVSAQEDEIRQLSAINLMKLSAREGDARSFNLYRQQLAPVTLPPSLAAMYHLEAGRGFMALGVASSARPALERALRMAETNGLGEHTIAAEAELQRLSTAAPDTAEPADAREVSLTRADRMQISEIEGDVQRVLGEMNALVP